MWIFVMLTPLYVVETLRQATLRGEMQWCERHDGTYEVIAAHSTKRLFLFVSSERTHSSVVLQLVAYGKRATIVQPEPHISKVPLGVLMSVIGMKSGQDVLSADEKENERLRESMDELLRLVRDQNDIFALPEAESGERQKIFESFALSRNRS